MIVKNEAESIARCLYSIHGVADEIVVVDTGSTDATREIATAAGAIIVQRPWTDDFSAARNASLDAATGEWILVLDADEELDTASGSRLSATLRELTAEGVRVRLRNLMPTGELCAFDESRLTRIFRNRPDHRYQGIIHEQIRPSIEKNGGKVVDAQLTIIHHGYAKKTAQGNQTRTERNLRLLETALCATPDDAYLHYHAGITCKSLGRDGEAVAHLTRTLTLDTRGLDPEVLDITHMKLAQLALAANNLDEAIRTATAGLAFNPSNAVSLFVIALASMFKKDVRTALDYFVRVRDTPDSPIANTRDFDLMIAHCRTALGIKT